MSHTGLGCQQIYWRQILGHQWGCRKSIICEHSTRVFRVVKHCTQTDKCPSLGYKGGAELKAWFGMENKGSLQLTTSLFKMLPDWSGMRNNKNSHGQEWGIICGRGKAYISILFRFDLGPLPLFSWSPCQFTDLVPPQFLWPWTVIGRLRLVCYWKRK